MGEAECVGVGTGVGGTGVFGAGVCGGAGVADAGRGTGVGSVAERVSRTTIALRSFVITVASAFAEMMLGGEGLRDGVGEGDPVGDGVGPSPRSACSCVIPRSYRACSF